VQWLEACEETRKVFVHETNQLSCMTCLQIRAREQAFVGHSHGMQGMTKIFCRI
jgi:hypothetical protein